MRLTRIAVIVLVGILLVSGLACSSSGSATYQLTTVIEGQGSVSPSSGTYASGSSVTLTALPASGWYLGWWAGDANGYEKNISITFDSDKHIYAQFSEDPATSIPTNTSTPTLTP
jgi:hypothetical protein